MQEKKLDFCPDSGANDSLQANIISGEYDFEEAYVLAQKIFPFLKAYFRFEMEGRSNLPNCPFLMVGNHSGGLMCVDSYLLAAQYILWRQRPYLRFLVHDALMLFSQLPIGKILRKGGAIRADYAHAKKALEAGFSVLVYPGGEKENNRPFSRRHEVDFFGHVGYVQLALEAQVPIVPVVSIGAHETLIILGQLKVPSIANQIAEILGLNTQGLEKFTPQTHPISITFPWGVSIGHLPFLPLPAQITIQILPPIDISSYPPRAAQDPQIVGYIDRMVRGYLQAALDKLAKNRIPWIGKLESLNKWFFQKRANN
ncbi:MAG: 1-acyl-sn-glycerol-3-phosphate acyltransferase [Bacteroidia bacterium]|nr:1-acyl-sn-glycerol-3-phosphate acyltransferase [Bacteroidia bacterium]MDW8158379.1 1-acyl-sn-glycerol-3-phosphate acyltransferase [Bacteroidia bacterium]